MRSAVLPVLWLLGLSGSGKTTLGSLLCRYLESRGYEVAFIDGDRFRRQFGFSGFSPEDRLRNINAMREYALHLANTATTTQQVTQARDLMLQSIDYAASEQEKSQLRQFVQAHFANPAAFLQKNK